MAKQTYILMLLFVLCSLSTYATTLTCDMDQSPLIPQFDSDFKIPIICTTDVATLTDYYCYSQVSAYYDNELNAHVRRLFQLNPKYENDEQVIDVFADGTEKKFKINSGYSHLNAFITFENLKVDINYTTEIWCSGNSEVLGWNTTFIPTYKNLDYVASKSVWFGNNASFFLASFFILLVFVLLLAYLLNILKNKGG